jgi:2'-5' RNA ligase
LFVAVYPPPEVAAELSAAVGMLDGLPAHRLVSVEQIHLTLHFIGNTAVSELDAAVESARRSAAGLAPFALTPLRLMSLPDPRPRRRQPARLVAAETDAPATLLEIHHRLAVRFARRPRRNTADRFLPHLTLCRFRTPQRDATVDAPLTLAPFPVRAVALMQSVLRPEGAEHAMLESFDLS